jgi:hypothetical protein
MYCRECGGELPKNDNLCPVCKKRVLADVYSKNSPAIVRQLSGPLGCLVFIGIIVAMFMIIGSMAPKQPEKKPDIDLNASVQFTGTQFIIRNNDDFDWTDVRLVVDMGVLSGYTFKASVLKAHGTYKVGAAEFVKNDGLRFNPFERKPQTFYIGCTTPQGGGSFLTGWDY